MNFTRNIIFGAGGFAKVVTNLFNQIESCRSDNASNSIVGYVDEGLGSEDTGSKFLRKPIYSSLEHAASELDSFRVIVALGSPASRRAAFDKCQRLGLELFGLIHPMAILAPGVEIGAGIIVMPYVVVEPDVSIGSNAVLNKLVTVGHDTVIGENSVIHSNTSIAGDCLISSGVLIGQCVSIRQGVSVGENSIVGAGASQLSNVPSNRVSIGVPGKLKSDGSNIA